MDDEPTLEDRVAALEAITIALSTMLAGQMAMRSGTSLDEASNHMADMLERGVNAAAAQAAKPDGHPGGTEKVLRGFIATLRSKPSDPESDEEPPA